MQASAHFVGAVIALVRLSGWGIVPCGALFHSACCSIRCVVPLGVLFHSVRCSVRPEARARPLPYSNHYPDRTLWGFLYRASLRKGRGPFNNLGGIRHSLQASLSLCSHLLEISLQQPFVWPVRASLCTFRWICHGIGAFIRGDWLLSVVLFDIFGWVYCSVRRVVPFGLRQGRGPCPTAIIIQIGPYGDFYIVHRCGKGAALALQQPFVWPIRAYFCTFRWTCHSIGVFIRLGDWLLSVVLLVLFHSARYSIRPAERAWPLPYSNHLFLARRPFSR